MDSNKRPFRWEDEMASKAELVEGLRQMQAALQECLAEWISKNRAANWQIINDASVNAARLIIEEEPNHDTTR